MYARKIIFFSILFLFVPVLFLSNSVWSKSKPSKISNACSIFMEKKNWYRPAYIAEKRWDAPIPLSMAFIRQESAFESGARPSRKKLFGFIPWKRISSSLGYSQAINATWSEYQKLTRNPHANRKSFKDSIDFVGWYNDKSHRKLGINKGDAYNLYLAYHEGLRGYKRKTWVKNTRLQKIARKVKRYTTIYTKQLNGCKKKLKRTIL